MTDLKYNHIKLRAIALLTEPLKFETRVDKGYDSDLLTFFVTIISGYDADFVKGMAIGM